MNRNQANSLEQELDSYQKIARRAGEPSHHIPSNQEPSDRAAWMRFAAAAGASLSAATSAEAAITWVVPPQPIRVEIPFDAYFDTATIDVDGVGADELQVVAAVDFAPSFGGYRYSGLLQGTADFDLVGLTGYPGIIHKLAPGAVIPAVPPTVTGTVVRLSATTSQYGIGSAQGEWTYDDVGFAGFVFGPSGSKRAGWIKIQTESIFNGVTPRLGAIEILEWAFQTVPGTSIQVGQTSGALLGDYNGNGSVGPEDYTKWKNDFGANVTAGTGSDGNGNAKVDAADYTVWRDNFGASGSASLSGAVPEPSSISLGMLALGAAGVTALRRR